MVDLKIKKRDTVVRKAIPTRTKLEAALRYLASGDSFRSLWSTYSGYHQA
jgi:hypothetical protein